ncbi:UPF0738 family protein [Bacillus seohaeanensis]|uniref:UPF0738 protein ACFSUL_03020 n=1 Tax=Bacillus seohaeanensis TaxID=284580 RepID=A0ABW5RM32_9BACI
MRKKIAFQKATIENETLILHTDQSELLKNTEAAGQVIVDSDQFAFVYLAENPDEYVYLYLEENIWNDLKVALKEKMTITAKADGVTLVLEGLQEELEYLVSNIEGNGNYGEEMVQKVESVFLA